MEIKSFQNMIVIDHINIFRIPKKHSTRCLQVCNYPLSFLTFLYTGVTSADFNSEGKSEFSVQTFMLLQKYSAKYSEFCFRILVEISVFLKFLYCRSFLPFLKYHHIVLGKKNFLLSLLFSFIAMISTLTNCI